MRDVSSPGAHSTARAMLAKSQAPDPGIAAFFVWMRRQSGLSIHQTAAILHTEPYVIDALEAGAIAELPDWPETARIVQAYALMLNADPSEPLEALYRRLPQATAQKSKDRRGSASVAIDKSRRIRAAMAVRNASRPVFKLW